MKNDLVLKFDIKCEKGDETYLMNLLENLNVEEYQNLKFNEEYVLDPEDGDDLSDSDDEYSNDDGGWDNQ